VGISDQFCSLLESVRMQGDVPGNRRGNTLEIVDEPITAKAHPVFGSSSRSGAMPCGEPVHLRPLSSLERCSDDYLPMRIAVRLDVAP